MSKLEYLIRKNKGAKECVNYKLKLSAILGATIYDSDFINLYDTDIIMLHFFEKFKTTSKLFFKKYEEKEEQILSNDIEEIKNKIQSDFGYLISKQSEICGLVKMSCKKALEKYKEIIELDGDSLCIISLDNKEGIYLDHFEEINEGENKYYYEMSFWRE